MVPDPDPRGKPSAVSRRDDLGPAPRPPWGARRRVPAGGPREPLRTRDRSATKRDTRARSSRRFVRSRGTDSLRTAALRLSDWPADCTSSSACPPAGANAGARRRKCRPRGLTGRRAILPGGTSGRRRPRRARSGGGPPSGVPRCVASTSTREPRETSRSHGRRDRALTTSPPTSRTARTEAGSWSTRVSRGPGAVSHGRGRRGVAPAVRASRARPSVASFGLGRRGAPAWEDHRVRGLGSSRARGVDPSRSRA